MNTRLELGRIAGIPIFLDMFFVLVLVVYAQGYFTSGNSQMMSAGLLIMAGIIGSILLHELAHAGAAWLFKTGVAQIELTALGGVVQFARSLPRAVAPRVAIYLAGPAANLALWQGCLFLAGLAAGAGKPIVALVLYELASINAILMLFNLLPAYPLDGGHALEAIASKLLGPVWGQRIVATLGLVVALLILTLAIRSLPGGIFMLLLAFFLAELNWNMLKNVGGWGRR